MQKQFEIFQIDAFTSEPFQGNPAAVVLNDSLNEIQMQSVAKEMNLSETAFLKQLSKSEFELRWFTPTTEVLLCGHATIAALHFLYEKNLLQRNSSLTLNTGSGIINAGLSENKYWMQLPDIQFTRFDLIDYEFFTALGFRNSDTYKDLWLASNKYLFIYIDNLKTLFNLKPDFNKLLTFIENQNHFRDIAVFTLETIENSLAHLRFFAPSDGINEDPATGSAAGPLLKLIYEFYGISDFSNDKIYIVEQGDLIGRKSRIGISYNTQSKDLKIYGNAVTVLKGVMII